MVTEKEFSPVFDYSSPFKYGSPDIKMKTLSENYKSVFSYQAITIPEDDFENDRKEALVSVVLRNIIICFLYVFAILLFPITAFVCLKKVHALERLVLLRLGKLQPIRGPGLAVIFPCVDKWTKVDLKPKKFTVALSQSLTADRGIVEVKSDVEYRVSDVINYVMKLRQQEDTLKDLCLFCLGNIVCEKEQDDLELKREIINCNYKNELNRSVLNWGLEIINVNLHSIKIIKSAEPVDAIGTLMSALKAATGQSSQDSTPLFPFMPNITPAAAQTQASSNFSGNDTVTSVASVQENYSSSEDILVIIKELTDSVSKSGKLKNLVASFQLEVIGQLTRKIFLHLNEENVSVFEDFNSTMDCDVCIKLAESVLREFLSGTLSPLNAYMDGKVTEDGDWKLLKHLSTIFH